MISQKQQHKHNKSTAVVAIMNPVTVWGIPLDPELRISVIRKGIPTIFTLADAFPSSSITVAQQA